MKGKPEYISLMIASSFVGIPVIKTKRKKTTIIPQFSDYHCNYVGQSKVISKKNIYFSSLQFKGIK